MRVVSHTCSNTEIVCALGCAELLVGVDDHSDHPPEVVASLARIGPDLDIDVDRVQALQPDLVITSRTVPGHEACVDRLIEADLPILITEPKALADIPADIRRVADALGVADRGAALAEQFELDLGEPSDLPDEERPRILLEWWPKPVIVPGRLSWATDLIEWAGGRNPMADRPVESSPVTDEEVQNWQPDAVVISWCGVPFEKYRKDVVRRRPAWAEVPAVANDRIHAVSEAWLGRPGPRLIDGLEALRAIVAGVNQNGDPPV